MVLLNTVYQYEKIFIYIPFMLIREPFVSLFPPCRTFEISATFIPIRFEPVFLLLQRAGYMGFVLFQISSNIVAIFAVPIFYTITLV